MTKRQQLAIGVANELKTFNFDQFKARLRNIEGTDVTWPIGCVRGDVDTCLSFLLYSGIIAQLANGEYKCLIESLT